MVRRRHIVALGVCLAALAPWVGSPSARAMPSGQGAIITGNPAPSPDQIHSLILRAIENQHRDDQALEEFERIEHVITRKAENAEVVTDITERVVPSGTGTVKLRTIENGVPVSPEQYRQELEFAVTALGLATHPDDALHGGSGEIRTAAPRARRTGGRVDEGFSCDLGRPRNALRFARSARATNAHEIPTGAGPGLQANQLVSRPAFSTFMPRSGWTKRRRNSRASKRTSPRTFRLAEGLPERFITEAIS